MNIIKCLRYLKSLPYYSNKPKMMIKTNMPNTYWKQGSVNVIQVIFNETGKEIKIPIAKFESFDILHNNWEKATKKDIKEMKIKWLIYQKNLNKK